MTRTCSIEECKAPAAARGWCQSHYARWRHYGDPNGHGGRAKVGSRKVFLDKMIEAPHTDECIVWPYARSKTGYGSVFVDGKWYSAHRYICEGAHGPAPDGYVAAHTCGNGHGGCVNRWHLRWTTYAENNSSDRQKHGTLHIGEKNPAAKLTAADVVKIREARNVAGRTYADLANSYGVSTRTIADAVTYKTWKHLPNI